MLRAVGRLARGLYELLVTEGLQGDLSANAISPVARISELEAADAADRIALHVARVLRRALDGTGEEERVERGVDLVALVIDGVRTLLGGDDTAEDRLVGPARVLLAMRSLRPDGDPESLDSPLTPLLDTTLLTNAPGEPRIGRQILTEIPSADRIDAVLAFIRRSGLRPMRQALAAHCAAGRPLRVLTTIYTGSTECEALEELVTLGAQVRISYDVRGTRLHAKSWAFHRDSGFSTAFIGSSNLTHSAQHDGLEWNVRVSGARNPDVLAKTAAVFESYWQSCDFVDFDAERFRREIDRGRTSSQGIELPPIELRPEPFQERLLEQVALSRQLGHHRNLLVAATGTGKTVMAAIDYARLCASLPRSRLLFVAHRKELLDQARATFRIALRNPAFGERWVDGERPRDFDHVFASIQSLAANGLAALDATHFDVVIVDEFHHAAADSYRAILERLAPRELLGLTATPERTDGLDVLAHFEGRIAAELRVWDAIDQRRLVPFVYYGIHDGSDLRDVPWRRGRGYDVEGLTRVLTADEHLGRVVVEQLAGHVDDIRRIRALGFCVSVDHARFMARIFRESGIPAVSVSAGSSAEERRQALIDLGEGKLRVLFSVDLFNEGVDLPSVDTLLLLRPTESATLFLQQLGRGLRRFQGKPSCTVLDFVGTHRKEFRFDLRYRALLGGTRRDLGEQIQQGFPWLPAGCHMELDRVASEVVLRSLRDAIPSRRDALIAELRRLHEAGRDPELAEFLTETGLAPEDLYSGSRCFSDLRESAGLPVASSGPHEKELRRAIGRLLHVDDTERLVAWRDLLRADPALDVLALDERTRRLARMLVASVADSVLGKGIQLPAAWSLLSRHPQVITELAQLFDVLAQRIDHLGAVLPDAPRVPLRVHARYTRVEILAAFGSGSDARVAPWQSGVNWFGDERTDVFAFTIDKSSGSFSPTTRYRDYAINRELIHWESQSITRADSDTGRRYVEHARRGTQVLLFARLRQDERAFWCLGPATYVKHESERPMQIVWRLAHPLPGDLFQSFAAAIA